MKRNCCTGTIAFLPAPKKKTPIAIFALGFCSRTPSGKNKYYERDYGEATCRRLGGKVFRYIRDWSRRHDQAVSISWVLARKKGWVPKGPDSYRQWVADPCRWQNRKKYYDFLDGYGRFHYHCRVVFSSGITEKQRCGLKQHIAGICGCEYTQRKNIYLRPERDEARYAVYMEANIAKTVKLGRERLRGGSRRVKPAVHPVELSMVPLAEPLKQPVVEVPAQVSCKPLQAVIPAGSGSYSFYVPLVDCGASQVTGRSLAECACHGPP